MSVSEAMYDSDQDVSEHHSKFVEAVAQLDKGQRVKQAERSEPTLEVSEYHLVKSGITHKNAVCVQDLVKLLGEKGYQSEIAKKLRSIQKKSQVLSKPLEKPAAERIKRVIGFENTKKDLGKWDAIIAKNRTSDRLFFPLNIPLETKKNNATTEFLKRFRLKSDLQQKLEEIDPVPEELAVKERDKYEMTLEEITLKRKEIARFKARQSYKEVKASRLRKIKSKKFHRIQRKERIKLQLKEFEELKESNPEEALAKLEHLDKTRALERMSLRHRSTGQWAKNKQIRAKYNKESRQVLVEQLSISRELTQKIKSVDSDDEENEENEAPLIFSNNDKGNPWMNSVKAESEIDDFIKSYRRYWDTREKHQKSQEKNIANYGSEKPVKKCDSETNELKEKSFDEPSQTENTVTSEVSCTFANQNTEESVDKKKINEETNAYHNIISKKITTKKRKTKLNNEKNKAKRNTRINNVSGTTTWQVEELQYNCEDSNLSKLEDLEDMFDSMEKNLKRKVDLKLQRLRKKLKVQNKMNKQCADEGKNKANKDYLLNLEFKERKQKPILDLPMEETTSKENLQQNIDLTSLKTTTYAKKKFNDKSDSREVEIDPKKYLNVKPKHLKTQMPDFETGAEDALDDSEHEGETYKIMSEAFADDDVVQEFRKEKEEEIKKSQPEDIDLRLPGWGSWAGINIKESKVKRKKRQFILKFPKDAPRKDENKGDVIIFEDDNKKLKEHLVSELPYPFTTVKDFEASMRAPLGRTFVPENAHARLIQPSVITKSGQVIEPMTEDVLVKKQPLLKQHKDNKKKKIVKNKNKM